MDESRHVVEDGTFLVRDRAKYPGDYVLAVVYKGKPTHHLVSKLNGSFFTVNTRGFGANTTLAEVWPVFMNRRIVFLDLNIHDRMCDFSNDLRILIS